MKKMDFRYIYGPVSSWRLGISLGIDLLSCEEKICNFDCIYCQLGRTTALQVERESFFPREDILTEITNAVAGDKIDFVTFVGDGEPTLNKDLGWLIQNTKTQLGLPVAVITNGSLLFRDDVRDDLSEADVVIPTLDAGNEKMFRAVNRPHRSIDFKTMLQGLVDFRSEFSGQMWIEVMLVRGLNDTEKELRSIKRAIDMIKPDRVYILTPIRPPAESWVRPSDPADILRAQKIIAKAKTVDELETGQFGLGEFSDARQAILETGSRHPLRREQALNIEKAFSVSGVVKRMLETKELIPAEYEGEEYLLPAHFVMKRQAP